MNNYRTIQQKDMHKLFPHWGKNIPTLGNKCSQPGNKTGLRFALSLLLMLVLGSTSVWGQVTYQYYAIHNKDNGYLKQVNGGIAVDKTFRYENSHDGNGSSIWVLSSDGYLQQEMYYLNVANDQTLYLSTEKVTQWTIDNTTASGKNYLKPSGSSKFLCADSGPQ